MRRYREEEPLLNKDKMKTMAFSNLVGSIIFLAIGIWAWFQTDNFPEVANTYVDNPPGVLPKQLQQDCRHLSR